MVSGGIALKGRLPRQCATVLNSGADAEKNRLEFRFKVDPKFHTYIYIYGLAIV